MTDLYRRASDRFERVIATAHASTLLDHFDPLDRLQIQLAAWEARQPFHESAVLPELLAAVELASGANVAECFSDTAPTVLARDWSADRAGGGR